jgi:hypothetical protein
MYRYSISIISVSNSEIRDIAKWKNMEREKIAGRLFYVMIGVLALNTIMDLYLWFSVSYLIPCFTVSLFSVAFIMILFVLKKYVEKR